MTKKELRNYAELLVKKGVNLQKKQPLVLSVSLNAKPLAEEIVKSAYKCGASSVTVLWSDEDIAKLDYKYKSISELADIPQWFKDQRNYFVDKNVAFISVRSDDPDSLKGISVKKISTARRAIAAATERFRDYTSSNKLRWCIAGFPSKKWAKKMFPNLSASKAYKKQWEYIAHSVRLDTENPIEEWDKHQDNLVKRCKFLNDAKITSLHYTNLLGTDFTVGLPKNYIFCGGAEKGELDGVYFTANMPTEEVFSSPDRLSANGTLFSAMPLSRNGQIIEDFYLTFKDGRIVDFGAKKGYENLKSIIETDEGSHYLGEIALIGYDSPIRNLNTLFFNTLYDENASCHFAIGDSYPTCLKGGADMTNEELLKNGLNVSNEHVDFMIGTKDLNITAKTEDGKSIEIFKNGNWTF